MSCLLPLVYGYGHRLHPQSLASAQETLSYFSQRESSNDFYNNGLVLIMVFNAMCNNVVCFSAWNLRINALGHLTNFKMLDIAHVF